MMISKTMSEHQRIHPVHQDVEAPHNPLMPRSTSKSDKGSSPSPFPQRTFPVVHSKPPKKRSCCCRFLCYTFSILLILIIAIAITIGVIYLVFRPKLPKYSVDHLRISQFNVSDNNTLYATFNVTITATNPNKKIGIYYEGGSHISARYMDTQLCEGSLPKFYQGHRNTTVLDLPLTGQAQDANGLLNKIQEQLTLTNNIPLNLKVHQPVRVKLGKLKLFKIKFRVRCKLVVDNLGASTDIRISSSSCKFRFRL